MRLLSPPMVLGSWAAVASSLLVYQNRRLSHKTIRRINDAYNEDLNQFALYNVIVLTTAADKAKLASLRDFNKQWSASAIAAQHEWQRKPIYMQLRKPPEPLWEGRKAISLKNGMETRRSSPNRHS